eukprot:13204-Eustigmatos_ZCMA.PRE.1
MAQIPHELGEVEAAVMVYVKAVQELLDFLKAAIRQAVVCRTPACARTVKTGLCSMRPIPNAVLTVACASTS